jgi:hypothetical protein
MVLRAEGAYRRGVVHSVCTSAASVADKQMLPNLLHGEERKVWGNGGYRGQTDSIHQAAPHAQDMTYRRTKFKNYVDEEARRKNTTKSKVRAKVEHVFRILKRVFGFDRVRYRGTRRTITGCAPASPWSISTCIANGRSNTLNQIENNHFRHRQTPQHQAPFAAAVQSNTCAGTP